MINPESKPSIEELLRLKRAERPVPAFWEEFDRELRAKQLAALVEKRPWWRTLPRRLRGMARYQLPLGATAVLAVTLLSIRDYQAVAPANESVLATVGGEPVMATAHGTTSREAERMLPPARTQPEIAAPAAASAPKPALSSEASAPGELARLVPMLSATAGVAPVDLAPSARSIAENRAVAEVILGTGAPSFETRALPVRNTPPEPLAQMSNPSDTRRSRFATAFAAAAETSVTSAPTLRVARRLSDEQLYDTIRRFGASGDRISFKF